MKRNAKIEKTSTKTANTNTKKLVGKLVAKEAVKAVKAIQPNFQYLAVGPKGTACVFGEVESDRLGKPMQFTWPRPTNGETHISLNARHASGRPMPAEYGAYNQACFVGENGGSVVIIPIADWRKHGLRKVSLTVNRRGEKITTLAYVKANPKNKYGETNAYSACPNLPYGRLEYWGSTKDKRNTDFKASLVAIKDCK